MAIKTIGTDDLKADDKGYWEAYKVRAEALAAARSPYASPTYWAGWISTAIAVGAFCLQYKSSSIQEETARLEVQKARFDQEDVTRQIEAGNVRLKEIETARDAASGELKRLLQERQQLQAESVQINADLVSLKASLASASAQASAAKIQSLTDRLNTSSHTQIQLNNRAQEIIKKLEDVKVPMIQRSGQGKIQGAASQKE